MNQAIDGPHFHIQWSRKNTPDWECFDTYRAAMIRAHELAGPDEEFAIQMVSTCPIQPKVREVIV